MKKNYCKPCAIIMQEKYTLTPLPCGKDYKAVCARCKRTASVSSTSSAERR